MTTATTKFEAGRAYTMGYGRSHPADIKIIKRTAKRVTFRLGQELVTRGITVDSDGSELIYPFGRYSMAMNMQASHPVGELADA